MSVANSLMLDFRIIIVPRFVYATGDTSSGGDVKDPEVKRRVADPGPHDSAASAVSTLAA